MVTHDTNTNSELYSYNRQSLSNNLLVSSLGSWSAWEEGNTHSFHWYGPSFMLLIYILMVIFFLNIRIFEKKNE